MTDYRRIAVKEELLHKNERKCRSYQYVTALSMAKNEED
jgi:hypothetical protein